MSVGEKYFMALTTLSVAVSVLVLKVHHTSPSYEVPEWVRRVVLGHLASIMHMDANSAIPRYPDADSGPPDESLWSVTGRRVCGNVTADKRHQANGMY